MNKGFQNQACICGTFLYSEEGCCETEDTCKLTSSTVTNCPNYLAALMAVVFVCHLQNYSTNMQMTQHKMYTSWPPFKAIICSLKKCSATTRKSYIHQQMLIKCCKSYEHRLLLNNCYGKNTASLVL